MSIKKYLNEFDKFEMISPEKVNPLVEAAKKGDRKAQEKIICTHQKFIISTAKKFGLLNKNMNTETVEDILSAGNIGLLNAIRLFDPSKGAPFLKCAEFNIRNALYENANQEKYVIHIPSNKAKLLNKVKKAVAELKTKGNEKESIAYAANVTGLTEKEVKEILGWEYSVTSLMTSSSDSDSDEEYDISEGVAYENSEDVEETVLARECRSLIFKAMDVLSEKEKKIVLYHSELCGKRLSLTEIGEKLGYTKQRIQQLEKQAYEKLRTGESAKLLEGLCA